MVGGRATPVLAGAHGTGVGPGAAVGVSSGESCRVGKHSNSGPTRRPVLVGVGAAVLVAAAVYGVSQLAAWGGAPPGAGAASPSASISVVQPSVSTTSPSPTTTTPAGEVAAVAELAGCVARGQAAQPVVAAATTGATHWRDHVQAQTDVTAGRRSLIDVKTTTWADTRRAGPLDTMAFTQAMQGYSAATGCAASATIPAEGGLRTKLVACAARQSALDGYIAAATAVMTDWQTHLDEMSQHSSGQMNSAQAQQNWLRDWQNAPAHLTPFAASEVALAAAPECTA